MLAIGLLSIAFIVFRCAPGILALSKTFIRKVCWILSNTFLASSELIMWFFSQFVYMMGCVDGFLYTEPPLQPWDAVYLFIADDVFEVFLDSVCKYFIEYIYTNVHIGKLVLVEFLCGLGIRVTVAS